MGFYANLQSAKCKSFRERRALLALMYMAADSMRETTLLKIPGAPLNDIFPRGMMAHEQDRESWKKLRTGFSKEVLKDLPEKITLASVSQILGDTQAFLQEVAKLTKSKIVVKTLKSEKIFSEFKSSTYDVLVLTWHSVVAEPYSQLLIFEILNSLSAESQKQLRSALGIEDDAKRAIAYSKVADIIFDQALFTPIYQRDRITALKNTLQISNFIYRYQTMFSEISLKK